MLKISQSTLSSGSPRMQGERGAAMVESVFVVVALGFLTGLLIDVAIGFQRYGELTDAISRTVRQAASTPCTQLSPAIRREIANDPQNLATRIRAAVADVTGNPNNLKNIQVLDSGFASDRLLFSPPLVDETRPVLSTRAQVHFRCFFCVLIGGLDVTISSRIPVEDTGPSCGYV